MSTLSLSTVKRFTQSYPVAKPETEPLLISAQDSDKLLLVYKRFYIYVLQRNLDFTAWAKERKELPSTNKLGTDLSPY